MVNWNLVLPPSRPSEKQLKMISCLCEGIDKTINIAVLGSTMEYRDLLFELGFVNVYVFEKDKIFYNWTNKNRIYNNKEHLILGDWLDTLPLYNSFFSIVLSDLTSGNISYGKRHKFYMLIEHSLKPGGVFFDKILIHNDSFYDCQTLLEKYTTQPFNLLQINLFNCEVIFCSSLLIEDKIVNTNKFYKILSNMTVDRRLQYFIEKNKLLSPPNFIWYYGVSWDILKSGYCPNLELDFDIIEEEQSNPYKGMLHYIKKTKV